MSRIEKVLDMVLDKDITPFDIGLLMNNEYINDLVKSKQFKEYKQKNTKIVDISKKEIWYIDVVKRVNAKVPKWFSNPNLNTNRISYAHAESLKEAKDKALAELAFMRKVKVSSTFEVTKEFDSSLKSYSELKRTINTSTNVELGSNDYAVLKQEKIDGMWYVALIYKGV